jgi:hypothetical protein
VVSVAVRHGLMDVIDGSLESASPCPPENKLWLQGTLIRKVAKDLVIPDCQHRALWAGVTTCYAEHRTSEAVMVETGSIKLYQNRPGPVQGKCCLKNVENFCLTLFWYSPTNRNCRQNSYT